MYDRSLGEGGRAEGTLFRCEAYQRKEPPWAWFAYAGAALAVRRHSPQGTA